MAVVGLVQPQGARGDAGWRACRPEPETQEEASSRRPLLELRRRAPRPLAYVRPRYIERAVLTREEHPALYACKASPKTGAKEAARRVAFEAEDLMRGFEPEKEHQRELRRGARRRSSRRLSTSRTRRPIELLNQLNSLFKRDVLTPARISIGFAIWFPNRVVRIRNRSRWPRSSLILCSSFSSNA